MLKNKDCLMNFSVDCLEIVQDDKRCIELYKNLSSKKYFFNDLVRHSEGWGIPMVKESLDGISFHLV